MGAWNYGLSVIGWALTAGGVCAALFGAALFGFSFGENGTGTDRRNGLFAFVGGVAAAVIGGNLAGIIPAPPSF